jgi:hypothetical protein
MRPITFQEIRDEEGREVVCDDVRPFIDHFLVMNVDHGNVAVDDLVVEPYARGETLKRFETHEWVPESYGFPINWVVH